MVVVAMPAMMMVMPVVMMVIVMARVMARMVVVAMPPAVAVAAMPPAAPVAMVLHLLRACRRHTLNVAERGSRKRCGRSGRRTDQRREKQTASKHCQKHECLTHVSLQTYFYGANACTPQLLRQ